MINYKIIADSIEHYENAGFLQIEAPWTVSKQTSGITKPDNCMDYVLEHNGKVLVASGEQSFLYMMIKGYLLPGRYLTVTPCFRDDSFDLLHRKYFLKNELIVTDVVNDTVLMETIETCVSFFSKWVPRESLHINPNMDGSWDIECKIDGTMYELGSYGIRRHSYLEWIYATGCAEPRLTLVKDMYSKWATTKEK